MKVNCLMLPCLLKNNWFKNFFRGRIYKVYIFSHPAKFILSTIYIYVSLTKLKLNCWKQLILLLFNLIICNMLVHALFTESKMTGLRNEGCSVKILEKKNVLIKGVLKHIGCCINVKIQGFYLKVKCKVSHLRLRKTICRCRAS